MTETCSSYFLEIEDHFRRARGTPLFRLSPAEWALIEAWQNGGIPLAAVLRGIEAAFEKWHRRPSQARIEMVNSLSYCSQAIMAEAQSLLNASPARHDTSTSPFPIEDIRRYLNRNAIAVADAGYEELAAALQSLDRVELYSDLEKLEERVAQVEQIMFTKLHAAASDDLLAEIRIALERELKPYRGKMTLDQIVTLECQFRERKLLEAAGLPRLSLFYL